MLKLFVWGGELLRRASRILAGLGQATTGLIHSFKTICKKASTILDFKKVKTSSNVLGGDWSGATLEDGLGSTDREGMRSYSDRLQAFKLTAAGVIGQMARREATTHKECMEDDFGSLPSLRSLSSSGESLEDDSVGSSDTSCSQPDMTMDASEELGGKSDSLEGHYQSNEIDQSQSEARTPHFPSEPGVAGTTPKLYGLSSGGRLQSRVTQEVWSHPASGRRRSVNPASTWDKRGSTALVADDDKSSARIQQFDLQIPLSHPLSFNSPNTNQDLIQRNGRISEQVHKRDKLRTGPEQQVQPLHPDDVHFMTDMHEITLLQHGYSPIHADVTTAVTVPLTPLPLDLTLAAALQTRRRDHPPDLWTCPVPSHSEGDLEGANDAYMASFGLVLAGDTGGGPPATTVPLTALPLDLPRALAFGGALGASKRRRLGSSSLVTPAVDLQPQPSPSLPCLWTSPVPSHSEGHLERANDANMASPSLPYLWTSPVPSHYMASFGLLLAGDTRCGPPATRPSSPLPLDLPHALGFGGGLGASRRTSFWLLLAGDTRGGPPDTPPSPSPHSLTSDLPLALAFGGGLSSLVTPAADLQPRGRHRPPHCLPLDLACALAFGGGLSSPSPSPPLPTSGPPPCPRVWRGTWSEQHDASMASFWLLLAGDTRGGPPDTPPSPSPHSLTSDLPLALAFGGGLSSLVTPAADLQTRRRHRPLTPSPLTSPVPSHSEGDSERANDGDTSNDGDTCGGPLTTPPSPSPSPPYLWTCPVPSRLEGDSPRW
ncbi:hypothetical protein BXZ70DRAFT_1010295 [Cristinia sonorae]|uniref:Uncharacterized protein n=1 Tax=Cristinia sonorae TaxID=1940300 RepID=A0A8K0UL75_9AGAR|nr:hypothetical protein BXZ70DRAFT_1010295 [Cristinia sonorae]